MKRLTLLAPAIFLASCVVVPDAPNVAGTPLPEGSAIALGQPVRLGEIVVTPQAVKEDSRCPVNARCVWAGRLVVTTRIDGAGWRDTTDIQLGETFGTHGHVIALVSGEPAKTAEQDTPPRSYRLVYELR
ncbi:hypothetical protein [Qipengyuania sp.]|uniref:hypothetical protein n=1 Tax=Qipengyuania sp. TaxID=2004515 RepID=UPI0035C79EBE